MRKTEEQFLSTLGSDYLANFEARLHMAEIDWNEDKWSQIKSVLDSDSSEKEKMAAGTNLLTMSFKHIEELLGETQKHVRVLCLNMIILSEHSYFL